MLSMLPGGKSVSFPILADDYRMIAGGCQNRCQKIPWGGFKMTRSLRHRLAGIPVLLVASIFIAAPAGEQPENLSNAQLDWDPQYSAFVISFRVTASLADRATALGYMLGTTLHVVDRGGNTYRLEQTDPMLRVQGSRDGGLVLLMPQIIGWDRNGGTVTGVVTLEVQTQVQTSSGEVVMQWAVATYKPNLGN